MPPPPPPATAAAPKATDRFRARMDTARRAMDEAGASCLLVTNPLDVGYLTGFMGGDSFLILSPAGGAKAEQTVLISDSRYEEELEPVKKRCRVLIRTRGIMETVAEVLSQLGLKSLGLQAEHLTLARRQFIADQTKGAIKLVETTGLIGRQRVVKDAGEVKHLKQAIVWQQEAMEATLEQVGRLLKKKGEKVTEARVAAMLEFEMKVRGSTVPSFETIVGSGANGALPHYRPGMALVKAGVPLLIDWGAVCEGYHGDMTRVFCFGKAGGWPAKMREVYLIVEEAHRLAAAGLGPGKNGKDVDALARRHIERHGYGNQFGHGLGHGIGLQIHEDPRLSHIGTGDVLRPGMVVTVEPGIYLPGIGGVRLENDYLITERGATNLCSMPMDLKWATR